jgi:hypothetical protein
MHSRLRGRLAALSRVGLGLAIFVAVPGCREDQAAQRLRTQARVLRRQIDSLSEMKVAAGENRLVAENWLAIAVDEAAVRSMIDAGLPQETLVADRFRVHVHRAEVTFSNGTSLVRLNARVSDTESPGRFADVVYEGGLDDIAVAANGEMSARVLVDSIDVPQAQTGGADAPLLAAATEQLAGQNMEALQGLVPPVVIPVKLQQKIAIDGFGDGPVQVEAAELPVSVKVARVLPLSGRLWIFLDVRVGPWRKVAPSPPASPSAEKKP